LLDLAFLITHYAGLLAPVHDHHHHWHGDDRYPPVAPVSMTPKHRILTPCVLLL